MPDRSMRPPILSSPSRQQQSVLNKASQKWIRHNYTRSLAPTLDEEEERQILGQPPKPTGIFRLSNLILAGFISLALVGLTLGTAVIIYTIRTTSTTEPVTKPAALSIKTSSPVIEPDVDVEEETPSLLTDEPRPDPEGLVDEDVISDDHDDLASDDENSGRPKGTYIVTF